MKTGYKRLLFFEVFLLCFLFINSFVWNILSNYVMITFLLCLIVLFKFLMGLEKDRHRYLKDILLEIVIYVVVFLILYYLLGIIIGFIRIGNYYTITGILDFIIPTICYIILREFLRYAVMCKAEGNTKLIILTILLFIFLDVTNSIYFNDFNSKYMILKFIGLSLLPAVSSNIVFSYFTLKMGYKPIIFYCLIMGLYKYLLPIIPNADEYLTSVIELLLPILLCYRLLLFYRKDMDEIVVRDYHKKKIIPLLIPTFIVIILVYLSSGYFHYWAIAVATGSMSPTINKGDVVIIEKTDGNFDKLKKGDVIAFRYSNVIIVHRIINIVKNEGNIYFYTKGDFNLEVDNFVVKKDMVIGEVSVKIPFVGVPTVWLSEL